MIIPTRREVAAAVDDYNRLYAEMDGALWCLSMAAQKRLLRGESCQVVEQLVWKVRSWWGVQGAVLGTAGLAANALAEMRWSEAMFSDDMAAIPAPVEFAVDRVTELVRRMRSLGVRRTEFSLSAKVLHWLMPWRVPVYDSFVRKCLCARGSYEAAYGAIAAWQFDNAERLLAEGSDWLGSVDPRSPIRALDKYLWRRGGGNIGKAVVVKDPWKVCRQLGIGCR